MATPSNPVDWLDQYGESLYRYALIRLRDPMVAEDMVQETLLAALQAKERYRGDSTEKTWLMGILKHKVIDHLRSTRLEQPAGDPDAQETDPAADVFDEKGRWRIDIGQWADPDRALEREDFWRIFADCLQRLPKRMADALLMREVDGLETERICQVLNISSTNNAWVTLSRARMRMRRCLESKWFGR